MSLILSIGEAMVELAPSGQAGLWQMGLAGDTLNTAWYLRRLLPQAWRIGYFSRVGTGPFSTRLLEFLAREGIEAGHVSRDAEREIGLYIITLQQGERSFSYWRSDSAARRLADRIEALRSALDEARVAFFSGITLAILPPEGRQNLLTALAEAARAGTQLVFDPNPRPRLWPDAEEMRQGLAAGAALADLVLPSFDDERALWGDASPEASVARYLGLGARQVVVKGGGGPVVFGGAEGEGVVADLPRVVPVDTTAAGDSFNAGLLAARLQGASLPEAIRRAHALSCVVIRHPGALVEAAFSADDARE